MATTHYCARCLTTFVETPDHCPNLSCGAARPKQGWGDLLGPGDLLDRHYQILKPLAVGGAGLTYLAREVDGSGQAVPPDLAIKVLYTQRDAGPFLRRLSNEAQILQELAHPHIVECRGFVHRTGHAPYLVTLFEHGGSLSGHIERVGTLTPKIAAGVLRQVLLALDTAHQRGVVHRDLKPENVLVSEECERDEVPHIRVTDFGIAKVQGGVGQGLTRVGAFVGTPEYAAPEQFSGLAPTPATDVFAAGGLLYYLLSGEPPVRFTHRMDIEASHDELLRQLPPVLPGFEGDPEGRDVLQDCIENMMRPNEGERWTTQQILARLGGQKVASARPLGRTPLKPITMSQQLVKPDGTLDLRSQETFAGEEWATTGQPPAGAPAMRPGSIDSIPAARTVERGHTIDDPPHPLAAPTLSPPSSPPMASPPPLPPAASPPSPPPSAPSSSSPPPLEPPPAPSSARSLPAAPARAPRARGGSTAGAVIGGMTGALLFGGGAAVVAIVVVAVAAWGFGWFGPTPMPTTVVELDPIALAGSGPADITGDAGHAAERDKMLAAFQRDVAPSIKKSCPAASGKATIDVDVDARGAVTRGKVTGGLAGEAKTCAEKALIGERVPRTSGGAVRLRAIIAI